MRRLLLLLALLAPAATSAQTVALDGPHALDLRVGDSTRLSVATSAPGGTLAWSVRSTGGVLFSPDTRMLRPMSPGTGVVIVRWTPSEGAAPVADTLLFTASVTGPVVVTPPVVTVPPIPPVVAPASGDTELGALFHTMCNRQVWGDRVTLTHDTVEVTGGDPRTISPAAGQSAVLCVPTTVWVVYRRVVIGNPTPGSTVICARDYVYPPLAPTTTGTGDVVLSPLVSGTTAICESDH